MHQQMLRGVCHARRGREKRWRSWLSGVMLAGAALPCCPEVITDIPSSAPPLRRFLTPVSQSVADVTARLPSCKGDRGLRLSQAAQGTQFPRRVLNKTYIPHTE